MSDESEFEQSISTTFKKLHDFTEQSLKHFLKVNSHYFDGSTVDVRLSDNSTFNAQALTPFKLITVNKGTIEFLYPIITNFFKCTWFLDDLLGPCEDTSNVFTHNNFNSSNEFYLSERLEFYSFYIDHDLRRETADSFYNLCLIFLLHHEIGHFRQFEEPSHNFDTNMVSKVFEMDADIFAVERLAINLKRQFEENQFPNSAIFSGKDSLCYFQIFIILLMFFIIDHQSSGNCKTYPDVALRLRYSINSLVKIFASDGFLSREIIDKIGEKVIHDFSRLAKTTLPNMNIQSYFAPERSKDLAMEDQLLEKFTQKMVESKLFSLNL